MSLFDLTEKPVKGCPVFFRVASWRPEVEYKSGKLADLAVVLFDQGKFIRILDFIGPGFSYLDENGCLADSVGEMVPRDDAISGLWMFEGKLCSGHHDTYDGREYDEWLEGEFRLLTDEERDAVIAEEFPWDPDAWLKEGWRDIAYPKNLLQGPPGPLVEALRVYVEGLDGECDRDHLVAREVRLRTGAEVDLRDEATKLSTPERDVLRLILESLPMRCQEDGCDEEQAAYGQCKAHRYYECCGAVRGTPHYRNEDEPGRCPEEE